ncbi:MAG: DUF2510 domain-containing protein, partial [Propionibacteriaceae bacterium]|nr:DUF2510 domain-containing protein [Propionibacteriaceae bacterium]
ASQAGWYPDPGGQPGLYRWWTGSAWSESVTPNPQGTPPPTGAGQPPGGPAPSAGYGQATSGYPGYNYPQQKRRGALAWWLVAGAAVIAVVVVVAFVVRGMGGSVPGLPQIPGSNPTGTYSPDICPPGSDQTVPPSAPAQAGWISSGKLAFPEMGGEWQTQYDNRVPWGSLAMEQLVVVQSDYDGESGHDWVASVLVSDLFVGDGFASTKVAAETVLKCVLGIYYSDTAVTEQQISSAKHNVDGHNGWLIETQLSFDIPGLETKGERVLLLVVQTGTDDYGLFYASIPDPRNDLLPDAEQAMAGLKVIT